ncbi:MAG: SCF ubiquitin ligase complex subunit cdc4 [Vezdaea aestivalis]|nr:MAG: SCF ubiquitin ligase complex subunit cdc4 [Vezdaea aestivalis]
MDQSSRPSAAQRDPAELSYDSHVLLDSSWPLDASTTSTLLGKTTRPLPIDAATLSPDISLGQFSYAPTTETKVVTTTTTTTTTFPPFLLKGPRALVKRDPKLYPLAASELPRSLKRFCFNHNDRPTFFQEADDSSASFQKATEQYDALQQRPVLRSVTQRAPHLETPKPKVKAESLDRQDSHSLKEPSAVVSISEAVRLANGQKGRGKKWRNGTGPNTQSRSVVTRAFHSATPVTPNTLNNRPSSRRQEKRLEDRPAEQSLHPLAHSQISPTSPRYDDTDKSQGDAMDTEDTASLSLLGLSPEASFSTTEGIEADDAVDARFRLAATATPPLAETDLQLTDHTVIDTAPQPPRPRLNEAIIQEISLPSPSLSPVTAAQNHNPRYHSGEEQHSDEDADTMSTLDLDPSLEDDLNVENKYNVPLMQSPNNGSQIAGRGVAAIPAMIQTFDDMPSELQTYMMYQFLRRCSKATLQLVADTVNPALKCDFLVMLPTELSLNVVRYLDVRSLCRAAQVSRKWRRIVDSNEQAWKERFVKDGYSLPDGELLRAINEGWGWQHPQGHTDSELDLSQTSQASGNDSSTHAGTASSDPYAVSPTPSGRPKRKATAGVRYPGKKLQKRRDFPKPQYDITDPFLDSNNPEAPYAAASAAASAIPNVSFGLSTLQNLHLFKSIYRRHHLMRKAWTAKDAKPKHIAFRAHLRHVVTCLQFDNDKIITGSDDTNINIYDTKTGALRSKLEGHEGGVWALKYYGNVLVSGSTDRSVRVWDIGTGKCTHVFQGHTSTVRCLQMLMPTEVGKTSDGKSIVMPKIPLIITGSRDSNLRVWRLPKSGDPEYLTVGPAFADTDCPYFVRTLAGHLHSVRAIAAHGDTLVSGSYDATVRVWKISTGETVHRLTGHTQKVYSVVLDTERNRCISGSMDFMVKVWNLETGTVLFNLEGHTSLVGLLDLGAGRLISAAADATLRIWDPENGQCKNTLSAHTGAITCFQHDFQKVISGSDRTLKIWDVKTGECLRDLLHDLSGVWQVKFNERRCVAAIQRAGLTYIEVLDYGASRDGVPQADLGRRIIVNRAGEEIDELSLSDGEDNPVVNNTASP